MKNQLTIAILGYGINCSELNLALAYKAGNALAKQGFAVGVGNSCGTFLSAVKGAKSCNGATKAVLEKNSLVEDKEFFDEIIILIKFSELIVLKMQLDFA